MPHNPYFDNKRGWKVAERVVERGRGEIVTHKASLLVTAAAVSVLASVENAVCGVPLRQDRHVVARTILDIQLHG